MVAYLFWNLRGRRLEPVLRRLVTRHKLDVLILAECAIPEEVLLGTLNTDDQGAYQRIPAFASRGLDLYSRFEHECFGAVLKESDHYLIRTFTPPRGIEIVLAMAHLASSSHKDLRAGHSRCVGFASDIRDAEKAASNHQTVVVGDLRGYPERQVLTWYGFAFNDSFG